MLCKSVVVPIILGLFLSASGCKKKAAPTPPPPKSSPAANKPASGTIEKAELQQQKTDVNKPEVKPQAEFDAQAKKTIDANNMKAELDRLEKEIQQEAGGRGRTVE